MDLKLSTSIASRQDILKLHRELRSFIDVVTQSVMRHDNPIKYPTISQNLHELAKTNQVDLRQTKNCEALLAQLEHIKDNAPSVHISFPSEPTPQILERLVTWFRKEIDPRVVIQVGLQPSIAAGVVLRTPNRQFDFSLRRHLYDNEQKLGEALQRVN